PAWTAIARGLADEGVLAAEDVKAPKGGWRWTDPPGTERVAVSPHDGMPSFTETGVTVLTRPGTAERWLEPVRELEAPRPARVALSTLDAESWVQAWERRDAEERERLWSDWSREARERFAADRPDAAPQVGSTEEQGPTGAAEAEDVAPAPDVAPA